MGSSWDFFGPISWIGTTVITNQQAANRKLLREIMTSHGFLPYDKEWWHFTLKGEPFPNTYFNF
jgi:D-alanyl-D-alanine dipeptidase